jgi:hypothetical protein
LPITIGLPLFKNLPGVLQGHADGGDLATPHIRISLLTEDAHRQAEALGATHGYGFATIPPASLVGRLIAKIAHATAIAEVGYKNMLPYLADFILTGEHQQPSLFIGGRESVKDLNYLHCTDVTFHPKQNRCRVSVSVHLFARYTSHEYVVVVGELKEDLSNRICQARRFRGYARRDKT